MANNFLKYFGAERKETNDDSDDGKSSKREKSSEYNFNVKKIKKWQEEFTFWNTPTQKPCDNKSLKKTWIEVSVIKSILAGFVKNIQRLPIKVTKLLGTGYCHRNYVTRHSSDAGHIKCIKKYIMDEYPNSQGELEATVSKMIAKLSEEKQKELVSLFNTAFWVVKEGLAFSKFQPLIELQEKNSFSLGKNLS